MPQRFYWLGANIILKANNSKGSVTHNLNIPGHIFAQQVNHLQRLFSVLLKGIIVGYLAGRVNFINDVFGTQTDGMLQYILAARNEHIWTVL